MGKQVVFPHCQCITLELGQDLALPLKLFYRAELVSSITDASAARRRFSASPQIPNLEFGGDEEKSFLPLMFLGTRHLTLTAALSHRDVLAE